MFSEWQDVSRKDHSPKRSRNSNIVERLCSTCHNIFRADLNIDLGAYKYKVHHLSPQALYATSKQCRICKELWNASQSLLQERAQKQKAREYGQSNSVSYTIHELEDVVETMPREHDDFDPPRQNLRSSKTWLQLTFSWNNRSPFISYHLLADIKSSVLVGSYNASTSIDSPATWSLCQQWIHDCVENHSSCISAISKADFYPSLLLQISGAGIGSKVRLISTKNEPPGGVYTTLSHCWGKAEVLKLTRATLSDMLTGLSITQLPVLYQDAITITLRLGVRYLWIDSLCIIQDEANLPNSDWMNESKVMGCVYGNSFCNIAANNVSDSHGSLLHERDTTSLKPYKIMVGPDLDSQSPFCLYPTNLIKSGAQEALISRGWVSQEQLLSPRALIFTKDQVRWECRSKEACESFPHGLPPTIHGMQLLQNTLPSRPISQLKKWLAYSKPVYFPFDRADSASKSPWENFWFSWKCIVEDYSARYITNPGDRLPAIAGLAELLVQKMDGSPIYMAGIWNFSSTIVYELGWTVGRHKNGEPASRPKVYRAPTWSWASMDRSITYQYKRDFYTTGDVKVAYIKDMQVITIDGSICGPIKSGFLDIEGPLLARHEDGGLIGPEDDLDSASKELYHLSLVSVYNDQTIWGLKLRRVETEIDSGCYRRVGLFYVVADLNDMSRWEFHYNAPKTTIRII